jgi:hypothetical protein
MISATTAKSYRSKPLELLRWNVIASWLLDPQPAGERESRESEEANGSSRSLGLCSGFGVSRSRRLSPEETLCRDSLLTAAHRFCHHATPSPPAAR